MATQKKKAAKVQPAKPATNQVSAYQAALALFAKGGLNHSMIVLALAQKHPALFIELANSAGASASSTGTVGPASIDMLQAIRGRKQPADLDAAATLPPNTSALVGMLSRSPTKQVGIVQAIQADNPVAAIKMLREVTGWGLRESKNVVDYTRMKMYSHGLMATYVQPVPTTLGAAQQQAVELLLSVAREHLSPAEGHVGN